MSIGLCRLLDLDHSLATTVACLLSAPQGGKVNVLSVLRVGSDPFSAAVRESLRGVPGELVTAADQRLLVSEVKAKAKQSMPYDCILVDQTPSLIPSCYLHPLLNGSSSF